MEGLANKWKANLNSLSQEEMKLSRLGGSRNGNEESRTRNEGSKIRDEASRSRNKESAIHGLEDSGKLQKSREDRQCSNKGEKEKSKNSRIKSS